jgi:predicted permease
MNWLKQLFTRHRRYEELSESIREHLAEKIEELMEEGMSRTQADHTARRAFGNVALTEERSREVWRWARFENLWADLRFSWRQLERSPGISIITVLTLALGLGANTAVFTLTWNIVLSGLPVPHPGQLVEYEMRSSETMIGLSGPEYRILRQRQRTSTDLLAWASDAMPIRQGTQTTQTHVQLLTGNAYRVLELQPYSGRFFDEAEDRSQGAKGIPAVLSYDHWQSAFHGDSNAIGQSLSVDNHAVTIVGVMPPAFEGLTANFHPAVYLPMSFANLEYGPDFSNAPGHFGHFVLGRLKAGVTLADAQAELNAITPSIRKEADPTGIYLNQFFKDFQLTARDGRSGVSWVKMAYERPLLVLEMLVVFVLALCCINTALVMMARVSGRQQEFAVRSALGAGRARLIRQVLAETLLLTIPGLIGGIFLGWMAAHFLVEMLGRKGTPSVMDLQPNPIIVGVNLIAALGVAIGAGLWPALRAGWAQPSVDLKAGSKTIAGQGLGGWAISLQVTVSLCLVSAAILLGRTLSDLITARSGFNAENAVVATVDLESLKLKPAQLVDVTNRLLSAVEAQPGVTAAGYVGWLPLSGAFGASHMFSVDRDHVVHSDPNLYYQQITAGYFAAAGTRILSGSSIATSLGATPSCVMSASLVQIFFPHQSPLGEFVYYSTMGQPDGTNLDLKNACQVVAVAEDAKFVSLRQPAPAMLYQIQRPDVASQYYAPSGVMVIRAQSAALAADAVKNASSGILPAEEAPHVESFNELIHQDLSRERMLVSLSGSFAVLALLLTVLGLYGLLMRTVTMRTREIGIRVALGANRREILLAIGRRTFFEVAIGMGGGVFLTLFVTRAARQLLSLQSSPGTSELLLSGTIVLVMALVAALVPARRAASVDPMQALRSE